jgi:hypothetical protein
MKETRSIDTIRCEYGTKIKIASWIVASARSREAERSFGVRFEQTGEQGETVGTSCLDFDEVDEFLGALAYLGDLARKMAKRPSRNWSLRCAGVECTLSA